MKFLLVLSLLASSLGPASAAAAPRPLVRYLAATLHLRPGQTRQVQLAVRRAPLALRTPEQVAERLRPVLSATQFERYSQLQGDAASYALLHHLAAQH
ncbi:hypothetical protein HHL22_08355 [Hymenobacter sp. RP-2-7]|uniref:Uncharacterized protein n=1 Tax=Hymenobacter polaris TaxID=2682546 RepID=A0A7Y0ADA0_9BACT|nr:hypothetical protein [Hymenobacter polaris]NML65212.1 hypothetical protein [Hymenobacter polaris]